MTTQKSKLILITGGSDGLGKTLAAYLCPRFQVVILSPNKDKAKKIAKDIGCDYVIADVTDFASLQTAVSQVVQKFGSIDCLINNAGLWIQGPLDENTPEKIAQVINVNTLGVIYATKSVLPQMKQQGSGLIININSQAGLYPKEERSVYNASKWAITGFTKSIQPELAKLNIGITSIHPGGMNTDMFDKAGNPKDRSTFIDTKEVAKVIEFVLSLDPSTVLPEIGIKHIKN